MSAFGFQGTQDGVICQLNELFGSVLNLAVIKSVAVSCRYDVVESSNKLLEIANNSDKKEYVEDIDMQEQKFGFRSAPSTRLTTSASYSPLSPKKSKKTMDIESAIININAGYKVLVLLRGIPGSGKSSLAKRILENTVGFDGNSSLHVLSTDDFFYQNRQGNWQYDVRKLDEAHSWNHRRAFQAMSRGFSPVIIDNTNTEMWEMKPYATMAIDYGYIVEIIEPDTHWCFNEKELAKRNVHGVPRAKIKAMIERYQKNITPQKLLSAYNIVYKLEKPPQLRLYPPLDVNVSRNKIEEELSKPVKSKSMSALSSKPEQTETINLMDFDDDTDDAASNRKTQSSSANLNGLPENGVDKILMFNNDTELNNVLQPVTQDPILISDDDEDDIYSEIEQAWGVNKDALRSWDIVTPISDAFVNSFENQPLPSDKKTKIETAENSTSTEDEYFRLLSNDALTPGQYGELKVVETVNHDINYSTPRREPNIPLKLMLDKGCMTDDIYEDFDTHIQELESLFPAVPKTHLSYWYRKCKGDLDWTIDFLLEAKEDIATLIESDDEDDNTNDSKTTDNEDNSTNTKITRISRKKSKKNATSEDKEEIKKLLESKIDIAGEHYSKHLLKVKNFQLRCDNNGASTSDQFNNEPSTPISDEIASTDSDIEFDEADSENSSKQSQNEETVELNLGEFFLTQLEEKFADPNIEYPKGFQPVVQMPVALAKQLYSFYIESVYQQMENQQHVLETLISEDEEFARKLQAKETEETPTDHAPSFRDIQEDQKAAKIVHRKEVEKWKNISPDTLAAKLTKQKLFSTFPTIPQDTLEEILQAHDNKYTDTVETLMASTDRESIQGFTDAIKEPPIKDEVLEEMKEAQKNNCCTETEDHKEATYYREEANKYLRKRADLYQKALQYHQRGMTEVAQFYSSLASLQTSYFDRANNMAAVSFLDEHSKRLQDFNTLDLHFLYVKEAVPALDVFLDRNINLLKHSTTKQSEYLQIITGRGVRSENGVPKIKPAVISRLRKRQIKYITLNPGLLKIKITKTSLVTSELSS